MMNSIDNLLVKIINIGKTEDKNTIFLIGNTAKIECNNFYFTPVRNYDQMIVAGIVVYKESIAKKIAKKIDGLVDYIFVDAEKKYQTVIPYPESQEILRGPLKKLYKKVY